MRERKILRVELGIERERKMRYFIWSKVVFFFRGGKVLLVLG